MPARSLTLLVLTASTLLLAGCASEPPPPLVGTEIGITSQSKLNWTVLGQFPQVEGYDYSGLSVAQSPTYPGQYVYYRPLVNDIVAVRTPDQYAADMKQAQALAQSQAQAQAAQQKAAAATAAAQARKEAAAQAERERQRRAIPPELAARMRASAAAEAQLRDQPFTQQTAQLDVSVRQLTTGSGATSYSIVVQSQDPNPLVVRQIIVNDSPACVGNVYREMEQGARTDFVLGGNCRVRPQSVDVITNRGKQSYSF